MQDVELKDAELVEVSTLWAGDFIFYSDPERAFEVIRLDESGDAVRIYVEVDGEHRTFDAKKHQMILRARR